MACLCGLPDPFTEVGLACRTRSVQGLICSKEGVAPVLIRYKDCTCIILQHYCSWACMLKTLTIILACAVIIIFVWFLDYFWSIPYHILYSNNVHMYKLLWRDLDRCCSTDICYADNLTVKGQEQVNSTCCCEYLQVTVSECIDLKTARVNTEDYETDLLYCNRSTI